jgi:hypothetical protein
MMDITERDSLPFYRSVLDVAFVVRWSDGNSDTNQFVPFQVRDALH